MYSSLHDSSAYGNTPQQPAFYHRNDWNAASDTDTCGTMSSPAPAAARTDTSFLPRNISGSFLGEGEGDEPPILEGSLGLPHIRVESATTMKYISLLLTELGINFNHIIRKTKTVLMPRPTKLDMDLVADDDFAGPLLFCVVLGILLLFNGKVFFGYIYGVFVVGKPLPRSFFTTRLDETRYDWLHSEGIPRRAA